VNMRSLRFRITAWYAGLLAGTLILFGVSVYLGLERYLDWTLQRTLVAECRTIGTQLLSQMSDKDNAWLATEINEAYAPEVNGRFIRVVRQGVGVIYASAAPKDGTFDPSRIPLANDKEKDGSRKLRFGAGNRLLIQSTALTTADGSRFLVESGAPYNQIEVVLHGLLLTLAIYMPFVVSLAVAGGYWLMRRSLAPVDEITKRAEGITSTNLGERLPVIRTGDELERLSVSLNRMIERLDDAFQHINRFSADASHELRTPLTILQLELEGIAQNHRDNGLSDQIGSALEETDRMSRIVESLLAISRLDAGEVKMDRTHLDLGELAASTGNEMMLLAEEKAIRLRMQTTAGVQVDGDRTRLQQVIVNLIDNAVKYTHAGGAVEIRVGVEGKTAVLEVADNGPGIPAYALPHVFERFYRADKARSRASGGTGLGLSIVKAICAAHNADVTVSSQEGRGTTFRVELPLLTIQASNDASAVIRQ